MLKFLRRGFMLVLIALGCSVGHAAPQTSAAKPYEIFMILFRGCEDACKGFQEYFRKQGIAANFTLRDAAQDRSKIPSFILEAKRRRPDLVLTWGTTVTQTVVGPWDRPNPAKYITDIPVVFMIVSDPISAKVVPDLKSSQRNLSGSLYLLPAETQIKAARQYFDFKRLGFIVNPSEHNSLSSLEDLRTLAPRYGFTLVEKTLPQDDDGRPRATAIEPIIEAMRREKVDLLYQAPDTFLNTRRDQLTRAALQQGIPVFAAAEDPVVHSQALFGIVNRYHDVGRFTASIALRILSEHESPASIPIELPRHFSYLVNLPVALELGRYPPLQLLDTAEIIGTER